MSEGILQTEDAVTSARSRLEEKASSLAAWDAEVRESITEMEADRADLNRLKREVEEGREGLGRERKMLEGGRKFLERLRKQVNDEVERVALMNSKLEVRERGLKGREDKVVKGLEVRVGEEQMTIRRHLINRPSLLLSVPFPSRPNVSVRRVVRRWSVLR